MPLIRHSGVGLVWLASTDPLLLNQISFLWLQTHNKKSPTLLYQELRSSFTKTSCLSPEERKAWWQLKCGSKCYKRHVPSESKACNHHVKTALAWNPLPLYSMYISLNMYNYLRILPKRWTRPCQMDDLLHSFLKEGGWSIPIWVGFSFEDVINQAKRGICL